MEKLGKLEEVLTISALTGAIVGSIGAVAGVPLENSNVTATGIVVFSVSMGYLITFATGYDSINKIYQKYKRR